MNALISPLLLLLALLAAPTLADVPYSPLQINSRESYTPNRFHLDDQVWRWLGKKQTINVAVWRPSIPPLDMFTEEGRFEGITADYVLLISQYLGLRANVHEYPNREAAIAALHNRTADLVVDPTGKLFPLDSALVVSDRVTSDNPVLVHARQTGNAPFNYKQGMQLAVSQWYLDYAWLEKRFPHARIVRFESDDAALASVAFGDSDFYIGSLVTTTYLIDRNYGSYLEVQESYPERDTGSRFVLRKDQEILLNSINRALAAIPDTQHQVILQQWGERADLWRVHKKIAFNSQEKKWLAAHPSINVSVNEFYAPFTMVDASGNFYGITADVLRLIQLRSGLRVRPVSASAVDAMVELQQLQTMLADAAQRLHPQQQAKPSDGDISLEALVNYESLQALTQHDEQLMRELLSATLNSNQADLQAAREFLEQEKWPELAKCIHRISGAAQIVGAQQAANCCIKLERLCQKTQPEAMEIRLAWQATLLHVEELNQAINGWLTAH